MRSFNISSHTADVRLNINADSLTELFSGALEALCDVIKNNYKDLKIPFSNEEQLVIESIDSSALLIDFLSEALTFIHRKKALFCSVEIQNLSSNKIEAKIFGFHIDSFSVDVKAVTYTEANIEKVDDNYKITVVLDI
jgi:SHS2 domain-containing protein